MICIRITFITATTNVKIIISITIGISWISTGVLCLLLAIPMIRGQIPRNRFYGARFAESFQSDDAWRAINHFGGKRLALWAIPLVVVGVVTLFLHLRGNTGLTLGLGFAPILFVLVPMFESWRFARRYGRGE